MRMQTQSFIFSIRKKIMRFKGLSFTEYNTGTECSIRDYQFIAPSIFGSIFITLCQACNHTCLLPTNFTI